MGATDLREGDGSSCYPRLAVLIGITAALPAWGERASAAQTGAAIRYAVVQVVSRDRFHIGPMTRICIETTIDPEVTKVIEASGQTIRPTTLFSLTGTSATSLDDEFRYRGWKRYEPRNRILTHINHPLDPRGCFDRSDTIQVRQKILNGKSPSGYRVALVATQGLGRYERVISRPHTIYVSQQLRFAIDFETEHIPGTSEPYWDPVRDLVKLSKIFVEDLLLGADEVERTDEVEANR